MDSLVEHEHHDHHLNTCRWNGTTGVEMHPRAMNLMFVSNGSSAKGLLHQSSWASWQSYAPQLLQRVLCKQTTLNTFQRPFILWVYTFLEHLLTIAL